MRKWIFGCSAVTLVLCAVVLIVWAQAPTRDTITKETLSQQYNTYVVDAGKAIVYAKQVQMGSVPGNTGESVESAVNRLRYDLDNISIDWSEIQNKPIIRDAATTINADQVRWSDDANGIFGDGTQNVSQALTYLDDVNVSQWGGVFPWSRIQNRPTVWAWNNISGRPGVWPGSVPASRVSWSSDAGGIFGTGTRNISDALSYLDDFGPASRWPTWTELSAQGNLPALNVSVNTTNFNGALNSTHSNVQAVADRVDDLAFNLSRISFTPVWGADARRPPLGIRVYSKIFLEWGKLVYFSVRIEWAVRTTSQRDATLSMTLPRAAVGGATFHPEVVYNGPASDNKLRSGSGIVGSTAFFTVDSSDLSGPSSEGSYTAGQSATVWGFYLKN